MSKRNDTRDKILEVANVMFAERGDDGTSIRDIAKVAGVNLAAINYHFVNKLNLYHEVVVSKKKIMHDKIKEIFESEKLTTAQLACRIYHLLYSSGPALINAFKIMLNKTIPLDMFIEKNSTNDYGMLGSEYFDQAIIRDLGEQAPLKARIWCIKGISTYIMHTALMRNAVSFDSKSEVMLAVGDIGQDIIMHVEALLDYIRNNSNKFL